MPKGQWTPPEAGEDAPAEVKDILAKVYSDYRDEHPAEDPDVKAMGARIAWAAVKNAGWEKNDDGKWVKKPTKEGSAVFDSPFSHFRLIEAKEKGVLLIDVHIISPGWGSSGYYSEKVLRRACESGVYPEGMHMHIDHPTRSAEKEQPARTIKGESPLAAVLTEAGHYDPTGWDGPGVYAKARVLPQYVEDIKAMDGHIGISHYVSGTSEVGEAEGKKGPIIKELIADSLNTVDFVTVPGAGGHYRMLFSEMKVGRQDPIGDRMEGKNVTGNIAEAPYPWDECMADQAAAGYDEETSAEICAAIKNRTVAHAVAWGIAPNVQEARKMVAEKVKNDPLFRYLAGRVKELSIKKKEGRKNMDSQVSLKVSEIMADPEVYDEVKRHILEEHGKDAVEQAKTQKLTDMQGKVKALQDENRDLKAKIAEKAAREYVVAEVTKAKLPEASAKILIEALVGKTVLTEDGSIDAPKFAEVIAKEIKVKTEEIAAIRKEAGITGNGAAATQTGDGHKALVESFVASYMAVGKTEEQARQMAEIAAGGR